MARVVPAETLKRTPLACGWRVWRSGPSGNSLLTTVLYTLINGITPSPTFQPTLVLVTYLQVLTTSNTRTYSGFPGSHLLVQCDRADSSVTSRWRKTNQEREKQD